MNATAPVETWCAVGAAGSDRRHGGLCCGCSTAINPCAEAHRCAALGPDSGAATERLASMPFDGAGDRVKRVTRMGSGWDRLCQAEHVT
jgi:hypothetical protein